MNPSIKRLVVACDGTWMNTDSAWTLWGSWFGDSVTVEDVVQPPSNVTRICRALARESSSGIEQIIYYQAGVGSQNSLAQRVIGGALGEGVTENIREAYEFIANNWQEGDEIVLLGFSRGAFTARSVAGLISAVGVLTRHGMNKFQYVFKDWVSGVLRRTFVKWSTYCECIGEPARSELQVQMAGRKALGLGIEAAQFRRWQLWEAAPA
jgi:uncharacterized protein (DUF2235 family)